MNVGQLKKIIEDMPDSVDIVVPGHDHDFRIVSAYDGTAELEHGIYVQAGFDTDGYIQVLVVE